MSEMVGVFTEEELNVLVLAIVGSYGSVGVDEDTIKKHIEWATQTKIAYELLSMLMAGYVTTGWGEDSGEPEFTIASAGLDATEEKQDV